MSHEIHAFFLQQLELILHLDSDLLTNRCVQLCSFLCGVAAKRRSPPLCLVGDHDNASAAGDNKHIRVVV
jgi:hypothetical protein